MERLSDIEVKDLQTKFIGNKIHVIDGKGERWVGKCDWLGYNENIPSWDFQVTMDRTPLRNVKIDSIKIVE